MDPVGQKPPSGEHLPSGIALSFEFLVHLTDLSRKSASGNKFSLHLPPALLVRALSPSTPAPVRFDFATPESRTALEGVLDAAASLRPPTPVTLEIKKEDNRLVWSFRGGGKEIMLTSALILSRPSAIRLERDPILPTDLPLRTGAGPQESASPAIPWIPVLPEETVMVRGGGLSASSVSSSVLGTGPVEVWPFFLPGETVEFTVRWVSEENESAPSVQGASEFAFSLDIPWSGRSGKMGSRQKVRVSGLFGRSGIALHGRDLPDEFLEHFKKCQDMMAESLRLFPGVALTVRFSGSGEQSEKKETTR